MALACKAALSCQARGWVMDDVSKRGIDKGLRLFLIGRAWAMTRYSATSMVLVYPRQLPWT